MSALRQSRSVISRLCGGLVMLLAIGGSAGAQRVVGADELSPPSVVRAAIEKHPPSPSGGVSGPDADSLALGLDHAVALAIQDVLGRLPTAGAAWRDLQRFYRERDYASAWLDNGLPAARIDPLMSAFAALPAEGLLSADYAGESLQELARRLPTDRSSAHALARFDVLMSHAILRAVRDAQGGRLADLRLPRDARPQVRPSDAYGLLVEMQLMARPADRLRAVTPASPAYRGLIGALARHREIAAAGGWVAVPEGRTIEPDARDPRVALVRRRLAATDGTSTTLGSEPSRYDAPLQEAVRRFQRRHGLIDDGRIGLQTQRAMNAPVTQRIRQIEVNLDRLRALPPAGRDPEIFVNIPEYRLRVIAGDRELMNMAVIVGREVRGTPLLSSRITEIIVNPTWTVPPKIAREDLLPQLQQDPERLIGRGFRVFRGWSAAAEEVDIRSVDWRAVSPAQFNRFKIRQDAGPRNALGRLRFTLVDTPSIYLHDTPDRQYFARDRRSVSSGCVRVERPLELAELILRNNRRGWDRERLEQAIATAERQSLPAALPMPVHLVYFTAWVDDAGDVNFRDDLYGFDELLGNAIAERSRSLAAVHQALLTM